jgi:glutamine amidotransferase
MGWNTLNIKKNSPLFESAEAHPYFYFVHSYYVVPDNADAVATTTEYGLEFVSGIQYQNIHAFQFHPEKSQKAGLALLEKFARLN